jgi:hypothetical protein
LLGERGGGSSNGPGQAFGFGMTSPPCISVNRAPGELLDTGNKTFFEQPVAFRRRQRDSDRIDGDFLSTKRPAARLNPYGEKLGHQ